MRIRTNRHKAVIRLSALSFVRDNNGCCASEVAAGIDVHLSTAHRYLTSLTRSGILRKEGTGRGAGYYPQEKMIDL
jgi:DNA-binding IclR family transcriptional regulator